MCWKQAANPQAFGTKLFEGAEVIPILGHLPHLEVVKMNEWDNGERIGPEFYGFDQQIVGGSSTTTVAAQASSSSSIPGIEKTHYSLYVEVERMVRCVIVASCNHEYNGVLSLSLEVVYPGLP